MGSTQFDFNDPQQRGFSVPIMSDVFYTQNTRNNYPDSAYIPQLRHSEPYSRPHRAGSRHAAEDSRIENEFRRLYSRVQQCEAFHKYREHQELKIDKKEGGDQVWPEHLEQAFFKAIIRYPPMGRGKQLHKEKQHGRNELIADYLRETTGERRDRKQVSSHIQVLKPFFETDPLIMKYFPSKERSNPNARARSSLSVYNPSRKMPDYPAPFHSSLRYHTGVSSLSGSTSSLDKAKSDLNLFKPVDFQMFIQRKCLGPNGLEQIERLHTYTQTIDDPFEPDTHISDWQRLADDYPLLFEMHARKQLDCNIVMAEASLTIPTDPMTSRGGVSNDVEIGISFLCTSTHLRQPSARVRCRNTFYRNGKYIDSTDLDSQSDHYLHPSHGQAAHQGTHETCINFGSKFWAAMLADLSQKLREQSGSRLDSPDSARAQMRGIKVVQEIFSMATPSAPERILVVHWVFRLTSSHRGRVCWKRLHLPPSGSQGVTIPLRTDPSYVNSIENICAPRLPEQQVPPLMYPGFQYDRNGGTGLSNETWPGSVSDSGLLGRHSSNSEFASDCSLGYAGSAPEPYDPNLPFGNADNGSLAFQTSPERYSSEQSGVMSMYPASWYSGYNNSFENDNHVGQHDEFGAPIQPIHPAGASRIYEGIDTGNSLYGQLEYGEHHYANVYDNAERDLGKDGSSTTVLGEAAHLIQAL